MKFEVPSADDLEEAFQRPTVAIDVGFGNSSSSGIAWSRSLSEKTTSLITDFGSCVDDILRLTEDDSEFNLILEAPLFGAFDDDGNPVGRLPLEKKNGTTRYWYLQAGANVGLGASFLLRELANRADGTAIHIFEGFVSFKDSVTDHKEDAELLLEELQEEGDIQDLEQSAYQHDAANCVSFLELLGFDASTHDLSCPLVVVAS